MKNRRTSLVALSVLAALAASSAHAAGFKGGSSNTFFVQVGESDITAGPHVAGRAGIAVRATGLGSQVDFQGLTPYTTKTNSYVAGDIDGTADNLQQVHKLSYPYTYDPANPESGHTQLGVFNFVKVGSSDIWFGEWSASGNVGDTSRTVYFIGANGDDSIAVANRGTNATYRVVGINNYNAAANSGAGNLLSGTFNASFNSGGTGTLTGSISNASGFAVNIGTASITAAAAISGTGATATQSGTTVATSGVVNGQFYNNQAALAGLVNFSGTHFDTAFGGTKN